VQATLLQRRLVVQMRPGMMGMSVEDTFELFALKVEICFKESVASVVVKSFASHTVPFGSNGCVCCKGLWQFRALLLETRIRMTHWPTPVSSILLFFFRTNLLIQHRMVHSSGLLIFSRQLFVRLHLVLTQPSSWGVMPTQVVHVLLDVVVVVVLVDGVA